MAAQKLKTSISETISELYLNDELCDVEFHLRSGKITEKVKGHKLIFAINSPVFKAMMYSSLSEENVVKIEDIEPQAFRTIKQFLYTDAVQFESMNHATSVYKAADKYDLQYLLSVVEAYISSNLTIDNTIDILEFSDIYKNTTIEKACMDLISSKTKDLLSSESFLDCHVNTLEKIAERNDLNIQELELFNSIELWAKYRSEVLGISLRNTVSMLSPVINKIRFLCMTPEEFIGGPSESELLSEEEILQLVKYIVKPGSSSVPSRFSISTTQRNPNLATRKQMTLQVTWTKAEVSDLQINQCYASRKFFLNDLTWAFKLKLKAANESKSLFLFLDCFPDEKINGTNWSCNIQLTVSLVEQKKTSTDFFFEKGSRFMLFNKDNTSIVLTNHLEWSRLTDPNSSFVKDGKIYFMFNLKLP